MGEFNCIHYSCLLHIQKHAILQKTFKGLSEELLCGYGANFRLADFDTKQTVYQLKHGGKRREYSLLVQQCPRHERRLFLKQLLDTAHVPRVSAHGGKKYEAFGMHWK
jgi:hypothetical protein